MHSSLELGMFFRRISYFFIIWRKDHFRFHVYANHRVRAVTACHALRSSAGLQGKLISAAAPIRVNTVLSGIAMLLSSALK